MKLVPQSSPYIRKPVSVKRMMLDVVIALLPVTIFSMIQNGWSSIYVILISILTMIGFELLCHMFIKWPKGMKFKELFTKEGFAKVKENYTINNILAPLISAIIYAMIMPAGCNGYVVFAGAAFGIIIGKMVFGGLGANIFNPAAVGRIFNAICFGNFLKDSYATQSAYSVTVGATPLGATKTAEGLFLSNPNQYSIVDLLIGNHPGSMGEVCILCILAGGIYLFIRRSADIRAFLGYIITFMGLMFIACLSFYSKYKDANIMEMFAIQLFAGGAIFAAVFMVTDPVTSPTSKFGRFAFGAIAGAITVLIRIVGSYPEGAAFSILIANMMAPCIDYFMRGMPNKYTWKQMVGYLVIFAILGCVISASVMGGWF